MSKRIQKNKPAKKNAGGAAARQKGTSHIDFAMAVSVMIVTIAFSMFYVSGYFSRTSAGDKTGELQASSSSLEKMLFDSAGIPADWENNNYAPVRAGLGGSLKRVAIIAAESAGTNHSFEEADVHIVFDESCLNTAYNNSIRVYDSFMNETAFRIYNYTECAANSGFLREANINFLFNITGNASRTFWLYYTGDAAATKKSAYNISYDSSLLGYWKFDSVNASNYTLDSTANHNDGKLYNGSASCFSLPGCINLTAGQIKSALAFDGADDYVDAGSWAGLDVTGNISISAWIYPLSDMTNCNGIFANIDDGAGFAGYGLYGGGGCGGATNSIRFFADGLTTSTVITTDTVSKNKWSHVAAVFDGAGLSIYINGTLSKSASSTGSITVGGTSAAIGKLYAQFPNYYFNGTIDEVRVWNRSLSADEIKALYNYTKPSYVASSGAVPAITHKKISAAQNLSYSGLKASLDMKRNFNVTACEYGLGSHIPDTASVTSSSYSIMLINLSGSIKPCLATVNIW